MFWWVGLRGDHLIWNFWGDDTKTDLQNQGGCYGLDLSGFNTLNLKPNFWSIMLASTKVHSVTPHNSNTQCHRLHCLPTHSAVTSAGERESIVTKTVKSVTRCQTGRQQVLFEAIVNTLTVAQLIKTFSAFYTTRCLFSSIKTPLSQTRCIQFRHTQTRTHTHTHTIYSHNIHSHVTFPLTTSSSTRARPFAFHTQRFTYIFPTLMYATFPAPHIHLSTCWTVKKLPIIQFSPPCCHFLPFTTKHPVSTLCQYPSTIPTRHFTSTQHTIILL
jgi:hypothetical protein